MKMRRILRFDNIEDTCGLNKSGFGDGTDRSLTMVGYGDNRR